jgi:hypothetical protein
LVNVEETDERMVKLQKTAPENSKKQGKSMRTETGHTLQSLCAARDMTVLCGELNGEFPTGEFPREEGGVRSGEFPTETLRQLSYSHET